MILVTGITGHTGTYFIDELVKNNYKEKIRCIVRNENSKSLNHLKSSGLKYELAVGDLDDVNFLKEATRGIDTIVEIFSIKYSLNVLEAAIENNVRRIIFVHTTGMFSKYKMASAEYKEIEKEVISQSKNKVDITILRPTMIFGDMCDKNISKFIKMVNSLRIFPLISNGKAFIQPINARDLGKAYYQVLINEKETKNKYYNLSGQEEISIKDMLKQISTNINKKTIFIPVPMWLSLIAAYLLKIITLGRIDIIEKVLRMNETRVFSHEKAEEDFGFKPNNFRDGLKRECNEFMKGKR